MLNVIADISHDEAEVIFTEAAQSGLVGLFHKATEGLHMVDLRYAGRKPLALEAGLLWGGYHFGIDADGTAQAEHFLTTAQPGPHDLLMLDFETSGCMTTAQAEQFVQYVQQVTGRYPGLYSTNDYLLQCGAEKSTILANCWLWIAEYSAAVTEPTHPSTWRTWTMWQYTDGQHGGEPYAVPGIGPCDRDQFNGNLSDLQRLWGVQPTT